MGSRLTNIDNEQEANSSSGGLRIALGAAAIALVAGCGYLWMRYGAQVFLDAALFAWRSCF